MNNHNFNESLINNLTIAEKVRYGFISEDVADTVTEAETAINILENYSLDLNNENCLEEFVQKIIKEEEEKELFFLEYLLDTILDSDEDDTVTLNAIQKALENKINNLEKEII